jgi:hypothetical protein
MFLPFFVKGETKDIPFTMDDRDRIIRTEQNVEAVKTEMNDRKFALAPMKREDEKLKSVLR